MTYSKDKKIIQDRMKKENGLISSLIRVPIHIILFIFVYFLNAELIFYYYEDMNRKIYTQ